MTRLGSLAELKDGDTIIFLGSPRTGEASITCCVKDMSYKVRRHQSGYFEIDCTTGVHTLMNDHINEFMKMNQTAADRVDGHHKRNGWIGVDLDGTLAVYDHWRGPYHIGEPIQPMLERVRRWIVEGEDVRIFTARVTDADKNTDGSEHDLREVRAAISRYCLKHVGRVLPITNIKDWSMKELWDDRAVQVRPNTGVTIIEELEAVRLAESGKAAAPEITKEETAG